MSEVTLNKKAYVELIEGDIQELEKYMPEFSLEKKHIIAVLNWSIEKQYPKSYWDRKNNFNNE